MRVKRLSIKAFGHFTDETINFSSVKPGLHIIYGRNEAGKSTALRALKALLFGMPERCPDSFLYGYDQMLVGACLESAQGETLEFWRRKKRVGDLLDKQMELLAPGLLASFLQGMEQQFFETLYGLDQATLVSGGKDILDQKGDVGQALFAAGAGLSSLHGIIGELDRECAELYKGGGSKPALNQAIKRHQELVKEIRSSSLAGSEWEQQRKRFESAGEELVRLEAARQEQGVELERLKRLQRAMAPLARRRAILTELALLEGMSRFPHDLPGRIREVVTGREQATARLNEAEGRKERLHLKLRELDPRRELLEQEESITSLHQRLGAYRQAKGDRPRLLEQQLKSRTEAEGLLRLAAPESDLSGMDGLKPLLARRQQIRKLADRHTTLSEALRGGEKQAALLETAAGNCAGELAALPQAVESAGLSAAVAVARKAGELDELLLRLHAELRTLNLSLEGATARLGLWQGGRGALLALALPSHETINCFADRFTEQERQLREARESIGGWRLELDQVKSELKAMEFTGAIPTEAELRQSRGRREEGWRLIRRAWLAGEEVAQESLLYGGGRELPELYEESVRSSDEISDRLRGEAERVHTYAACRGLAEKLEEQIGRTENVVADLLCRGQELESQWCAAWRPCSITPLTPREMRGWLDRALEVRRQAEEISRREGESGPLMARRESLRTQLRDELTAVGRRVEISGDGVGALLAAAEALLGELQESNRRREKLTGELKRLTDDAAAARREVTEGGARLEGWREEWRCALQAPGMLQEAAPDEMAELLERLAAAFNRRDAATGFQERIDAIDLHAGDFERDASALVSSVAPELAGLPAEQSVVKLQGMLTVAKNAASVLASLMKEFDAAEDEAGSAGRALRESLVACDSLMTLCGTPDRERLQEMGERFAGYLLLRGDLEKVEESLAVIAEGVALDRIEELARETDPDTLPGRVGSLERTLNEETDPQLRLLAERKGAARTELERMDGSARAAELAENAEAELATIRRLAERYLRLRLAGQLLRREIEQYRREHQDPVLKIASRYFCELTLGALVGLRTDLDDAGRPVLVGVTAGGSFKGVEAMSSGTRDQLYLALRLATIEWRLQSHPPMPFIADDLLINFDDDRSRATLGSLARLAEQNQVILFTHHREIVRQAGEMGLPEMVFVHELEARDLL